MKDLLFISTRPIFPIVGGDQIRTFQSLQFLKKYFKIHLIVITPTTISTEIRLKYEEYGSFQFFEISKIEHIYNSMRFLRNTLPIQVNYFYSSKVQTYIDKIINKYDAVFCNNIRTAEYFRRHSHIIRVIDFVDAISMNYDKARLHANWRMKLIYNIDYRRCKSYESIILKEFEGASVISNIDKEYILNNSTIKNNIWVVGNMAEVTEIAQDPDAHNIVFVGKMNYAPNVLAVMNFVKNVLPMIKESMPDVVFYIVGAFPSRLVRRLSKEEDVVVTGFVDDVNFYFNLASLVVAPMLSGAGIQNKIIQAMGRGKCIVTTPIGAEGLTVNNNEIAIVQDNRSMADVIIYLLRHKNVRQEMGHKARTYVKNNLSFKAISEQFYELIASFV